VFHLTRTDLGVRTEGLGRAQVTLPARPYSTPAARADFYDRLLERLDSSAALSDWPLLAEPIRHPLEADGVETAGLTIGGMAVTGQFFDTLGIKIVEGRAFTNADRLGAEPVAIVSQDLARRLWPAGSAIGRRIRTGEEVTFRAPLGSWRTIVGVAADVRQTVTDEDLRDVYLPFHQVPNRFTSIVFRANGPAPAWFGALREAVGAINPEVALMDSPSLSFAASRQLAGPRFLASLLTGFAIFTALLAVLGLYGVVTYTVQQREREIAIRMALGATSGGVTAMLVRHGSLLLAAGLTAGLVGAIGVTRMLQTELHGVRPFDPLTLATTCLLLGSAGLLATWWPARRASRRSPLVALKGE
jgi:predicted permease